jgi:hypothetical protein
MYILINLTFLMVPTASLAVAAVSLVAVTLIMMLPTDSELQQLCPLALHDQIRLVDHVPGSSHSGPRLLGSFFRPQSP